MMTSPTLMPMRNSSRRSSEMTALRCAISFCISMAQRAASTALANSTRAESPGVLTMRPRCCFDFRAISSRHAFKPAKVPSSSLPIRRLYPATSAARMAASRLCTRSSAISIAPFYDATGSSLWLAVDKCLARPRCPLWVKSGRRSGVRPCWWTVSGGGSDRLLGVSILVLHGAQIAQRGMESASVVNFIDEAGKISCNVLKDFVGHQIHGFNLQCFHEALGLGVVVGIATPTHGASETVLSQDHAIVFGGIL